MNDLNRSETNIRVLLEYVYMIALRRGGNFSDTVVWRTNLSRRGADSHVGSEGTRPAFVMSAARFVLGLRVRFMTRSTPV
jgi:hypothetical protein